MTKYKYGNAESKKLAAKAINSYFLPWKFRNLNIKFQEIEGKVVIMLFNVTEAVKKYPNVLWTHIADIIAS